MKWAVATDYRPDNPAGDAFRQALGRQQAVVQHMRALPHDAVADALAIVRTSRGIAEMATGEPYAVGESIGDPVSRASERLKVGRRRALAFEPLPSCLPASFAARPRRSHPWRRRDT